MTFDRFCAKNFIPFRHRIAFELWLAARKPDDVSEAGWLKLWKEFVDAIDVNAV